MPDIADGITHIAYISSKRRYRCPRAQCAQTWRRKDRTTLFLDIDNKKGTGNFYTRLLGKIRVGGWGRFASIVGLLYYIPIRRIVVWWIDTHLSTIYDSIRASSFYRNGDFLMNTLLQNIYIYIFVRVYIRIELYARSNSSTRRRRRGKVYTGDNVKCALTFACIGQRSVKFKKVETRV